MYVTIYQYDNGVVSQVLTIEDREVCRLIMADEQTRPVLLKVTPPNKQEEYRSILMSLRHVCEQGTRFFAVRTEKPVMSRSIEEGLLRFITGRIS